jgi:hypothetical protein
MSRGKLFRPANRPDADAAQATAELSRGRLCVRLPRQTGVRVVPLSVKAEDRMAFRRRDCET